MFAFRFNLRFFFTFIFRATYSNSYKHWYNGGCHARCPPAHPEHFGVQCLAQGHVDMRTLCASSQLFGSWGCKNTLVCERLAAKRSSWAISCSTTWERHRWSNHKGTVCQFTDTTDKRTWYLLLRGGISLPLHPLAADRSWSGCSDPQCVGIQV